MSAADLVFRNALIVDGSGSPGFEGDVAVGGGEILAVGRFDGQGAEEIDATNAN